MDVPPLSTAQMDSMNAAMAKAVLPSREQMDRMNAAIAKVVLPSLKQMDRMNAAMAKALLPSLKQMDRINAALANVVLPSLKQMDRMNAAMAKAVLPSLEFEKRLAAIVMPLMQFQEDTPWRLGTLGPAEPISAASVAERVGLPEGPLPAAESRRADFVVEALLRVMLEDLADLKRARDSLTWRDIVAIAAVLLALIQLATSPDCSQGPLLP